MRKYGRHKACLFIRYSYQQSSLTMITAVELIMDEYDLGPPEWSKTWLGHPYVVGVTCSS